MNTTTNYSLPQWEATDRITRSSVNGAMSSVDAALAANAPRLVKLREYATTAAETTQIDVDVSAIALGDYALLLLLVEGRMDSSARGISLLVNGAASGYASNASRLAYGGESACALLYPRPRDAMLHCIVFTVPQFTRDNYGVYTRSYEGVSTINVAIASGSGPFLPGSRVSLWGIKN